MHNNIKKIYFCLILLIMLILNYMIIENYNSDNKYSLDKVQLVGDIKINNKNLAIMVQKEDGSGYEEVNSFPVGLPLNTTLSGCIDKDGNEIDNAITYSVDTMNLKIKSKGSSYCYLYFIRDAEPPTITVNVIDNYYTSAKLSIVSNEEGAYCVNASNTIGDTTNCTLQGVVIENIPIITNNFAKTNQYYVHVKDNAGNETVSNILDVQVLYQKVEYITTTGTQYINSGVEATNAAIDFTLQFTDTTANDQGVIGSRTAFATGNTRNNLFWSVSESKNTLRLDWNGIGSNRTYSSSLALNNDVNIKLHQGSNVTVNGTTYTSTATKTTSTLKMYIGTFNANGTAWSAGVRAKWKMVKMYTSGELVRDFIPVYRTSDNVVGMFDEVNKVFYTNSGSGTFGKGSDINPDAPSITTNVLDNNTKNTKIVFTSSKKGTYCINANSTRNDMNNCIYEGSIEENETITTTVVEESGTYYVHVKDSEGNYGVGSVVVTVGLYLGEYLIDNNISGLQQTLIGTDTLYRFSGTNGNTGINNYICLGAISCASGSENMYRIIGVEPDTGYVKVINTGSYGYGQINSTTTIPTWATSTLYSTLNSTWYESLSFKNLIQEHSWNVGAISSTSYVTNRSNVLSYEDNATVTANIGMFALSDYYLAYNGDQNWNTTYSNYSNNWIHADRIWTMAYASSSAGYWILDATGQVRMTTGVNITNVNARPTFFLKSNIMRVDGDGSSSNPFIIELVE